jgi:ferredoxin
MTLPKRTYEKPLPISPSIVLDRERCILCYRCTRFSSDVAEDGELVARERGSSTVIATFQEHDYVNAFSGNVTELCPVGAPPADALPLPGAAVGDRQRPDGLPGLSHRVQHVGDAAREPGRADPLPQPRGRRQRLALRPRAASRGARPGPSG